MKTAFLSLLPAFLIAAGTLASAQQLDTLTLERAVVIALEHQPALHGSEADVRAAEAGARQSRAGFFPLIGATASGIHTEGVSVVSPSIPTRRLTYNTYTAALQGNLTIWDFGKTSGRVSQSDYLADAAGDDYVSARENLAVNTEVAFLGYLQAQRVVRVNEEAYDQASRHLAQAQAFFSVGKRPQLDVTKAEVDMLNANVTLIQARNALRVARIGLENIMGIHPAHEYTVSESASPEAIDATLDSARVSALRNRSELIAAVARVDAGKGGVTAAWGQRLPTIAATGTYTWNGYEFPLYDRWNAGVTFSLPIFQGFGLVAGVELAEANEDIAQANLDVLKESISLEVEQQWLAVHEAAERAAATAKLVEQATENFRLVERQYAAGVATALDQSDAQLTLSNARITDIQAQYDHRTALVRLRRAMGISVLPSIH